MTTKAPTTDVSDFLTDLEAGTWEPKINHAITQAALSAMEHSRQAEVTLTFKMSPYSASQININHKLSIKMPTLRGDKTESMVGKTALCITSNGRMTQFPENQSDMFQTKKQEA